MRSIGCFCRPKGARVGRCALLVIVEDLDAAERAGLAFVRSGAIALRHPLVRSGGRLPCRLSGGG